MCSDKDEAATRWAVRRDPRSSLHFPLGVCFNQIIFSYDSNFIARQCHVALNSHYVFLSICLKSGRGLPYVKTCCAMSEHA